MNRFDYNPQDPPRPSELRFLRYCCNCGMLVALPLWRLEDDQVVRFEHCQGRIAEFRSLPRERADYRDEEMIAADVAMFGPVKDDEAGEERSAVTGAVLQQMRLATGYSVVVFAAYIGARPKYLEALENENFAVSKRIYDGYKRICDEIQAAREEEQ